MQGLRVHITGIVQGVGFRPFVYNLALRHGLNGWVRNTSAGVEIEVDGDGDSLDLFLRGLRDEAPPLARIDHLRAERKPPQGFQALEILASEAREGASQPISPDVATCEDCLRELFDPDDRRYRYPFINCTNCGPRLTIIRDIPSDRPQTTMAPFLLCADCERKYTNPLDRRFHAQPVACPVCGPKVTFELDRERVLVRGCIEALIRDVRRGVPRSKTPVRFHNGLAACALEACTNIRSDSGIQEVVLSEGVWQNVTLLERTVSLLARERFTVYLHREVPANDGGLSLGQAVIAAARLRGG